MTKFDHVPVEHTKVVQRRDDNFCPRSFWTHKLCRGIIEEEQDTNAVENESVITKSNPATKSAPTRTNDVFVCPQSFLRSSIERRKTEKKERQTVNNDGNHDQRRRNDNAPDGIES